MSSDESQSSFSTTEEKYLHGLMYGSKLSKRNAEVAFVEGRGRSAFARRDFMPGDFVCEYTSIVQEKKVVLVTREVKNLVLVAIALMQHTTVQCLPLMLYQKLITPGDTSTMLVAMPTCY